MIADILKFIYMLELINKYFLILNRSLDVLLCRKNGVVSIMIS